MKITQMFTITYGNKVFLTFGYGKVVTRA